jgi:fatty acid CoA ligase FadD9
VAIYSRSLQTYLIKNLEIPHASFGLLLCENCPEWAIADFANVFAGLVTVPVAITTPSSQLAAVIKLTSVVFATCGLNRVSLLASALEEAEYTRLTDVIVIATQEEIENSEACARLLNFCKRITCYYDTVKLEKLEDFEPLRPSEAPQSVLTLTFSSGSTGTPKAATISDKWLNRDWNQGLGVPRDIFAYEPLAYSSQRLLLVDSLTSGGYTVFFSGNMATFFEELREAAPNALFAPPRIWNMLYAIFKAKVAKYRYEEGGTEEGAKSKATYEIRSYLGPNMGGISTGGAPTSPEVWNWMKECFSHIDVSEGYGCTETGSISRNGIRCYNCHVHLDDVPELGYDASTRPAAKGLLWVRTDEMALGYFNNESATETNFRIRDDVDGERWYNTGDIVEYNYETDALRVIDRYGNITKLAQSCYVSPEHLENTFIASPFIESIFVYAEPAFEHVLAVVLPNVPVLLEAAKKFGVGVGEGEGEGEDVDLRALCEDERIVEVVTESIKEIAKANKLLPHEIPPKIILEPERWSVESGLYTVSHKLARIPLRLKYSEKLRELHGGVTGGRKEGEGKEEGKGGGQEGEGKEEGEGEEKEAGSKLEMIFRECLPPLVLQSKEKTLSELGIDSISILQVSTILNSHFGSFDLSLLFSATVGDLLEMDPTDYKAKRESFESDLSLDPTLASFPSVPISSPPSPSLEFKMFLTGATGFVGGQILFDCLRRYPRSTVACLVRGQGGKTPWERLRESMAYYDLGIDEGRVEIVDGTLEAPFFGLPEADFDALAGSLDYIVHAGCWVNGVLKYNVLRGSNVLGTIECLRLAHRAKKLRKFCYVSSLSVQEFHVGGKLSEGDIPRLNKQRLALGTGYGITKCVSEMLVHEAFTRGLPACITRPGTIFCGSSGHGNTNDTITKYLLSIVQMKKAPSLPGSHLSLVSVCYVSEVTLAATLFPEDPQKGKLPVLHCLESSFDHFFSLSAITALAREAGHVIEEMDYPSWIAELMSQQDPKICPLVPIKSYFMGLDEFPLGLDNLGCEDKVTREFVEKFNNFCEPPIAWNHLKPEDLRTFFVGLKKGI